MRKFEKKNIFFKRKIQLPPIRNVNFKFNINFYQSNLNAVRKWSHAINTHKKPTQCWSALFKVDWAKLQSNQLNSLDPNLESREILIQTSISGTSVIRCCLKLSIRHCLPLKSSINCRVQELTASDFFNSFHPPENVTDRFLVILSSIRDNNHCHSLFRCT